MKVKSYIAAVFGPQTSSQILGDILPKIEQLRKSEQEFNKVASVKREAADELIIEASSCDKEAALCGKFATKIEEFFE